MKNIFVLLSRTLLLKFVLVITAVQIGATNFAVAGVSDIVGTWRGVGAAYAVSLTFERDKTLIVDNAGTKGFGTYQIDTAVDPQHLTVAIPNVGRTEALVEFIGPDEFREEVARPNTPRPKQFTRLAATFVRQPTAKVSQKVAFTVPGSTLTKRGDGLLLRDVARNISACEYRHSYTSKESRISDTAIIEKPQNVNFDSHGKIIAHWIESWTVQRPDSTKQIYTVEFRAQGSLGTTFKISPAR